MHMLSVLLLAISANLDNLLIGLSLGVRKVRLPFASNLMISGIVLAGTAVSMLCGDVIEGFLPARAAEWLGSGILMLFGVVCLTGYFVRQRKSAPRPQTGDTRQEKRLDVRSALTVGLALALNNMGLGVGASIAGLGWIETSAASFVFSLTLLWLGNHLGKSRLPHPVERFAEPLSGLLIIAMAVYEMFA